MSEEPKFTYRASSNGSVMIFHATILATTLRGADATKFLKKAEGASNDHQQQLMARLTGNYKRGNERQARGHPRNR